MFNFYRENVMNYNLALTKFFYLPFLNNTIYENAAILCTTYTSDEAIYKFQPKAPAKASQRFMLFSFNHHRC